MRLGILSCPGLKRWLEKPDKCFLSATVTQSRRVEFSWPHLLHVSLGLRLRQSSGNRIAGLGQPQITSAAGFRNLRNAKGRMGKIKLFPTPEYTSKQASDPVVPLVPCTGIFLGPSKSGKTVALISLILEQYKRVFERIYVFSPSVNIDDGWIPVKKYIEQDLGVMSAVSGLVSAFLS